MKKIGWFFAIVIILAGGILFWLSRPGTTPIKKSESVLKPKQEKTTEVIKAPVAPKKVTFLFGGDLMFDRYVNHTFKDIGFDKIFAGLEQSLFGQDIVFANLEGPVSDKPINDDYTSGSMVFNMPTAAIDGLKSIKINGVSLANNHTLNAGKTGFLTTQNLLAAAGIKYGGYQNTFDSGSVVRYETEIPISIIMFNYLEFQKIDEVAAMVRGEKTAGRFVIIYPHWGNEYALRHNKTQENIAHRLIDAGADLIIGGHPHVVQDVEIYNNHAIFYSLGNFVFDQLFSKETQEGLLLTGEISENNLTIKINPFKAEKMRLRPANEIEKKEILERINHGGEVITLDLNT